MHQTIGAVKDKVPTMNDLCLTKDCKRIFLTAFPGSLAGYIYGTNSPLCSVPASACVIGTSAVL